MKILALLLLSSLFFPAATPSTASSYDLVITNARIIDGKRGEVLRGPGYESK